MEIYEYIIGDKKATLFNPCPECREIELKIITGELPRPEIPKFRFQFRCWIDPDVFEEE